MNNFDAALALATGRRRFLAGAAIGGGALAVPAIAQGLVNLGLPGGPSQRPTTSGFPGKREMILQRVRPPLLETPMEVFGGDVFTPNDRFFVRWHWDVPTSIDVDSYRLTVDGHVERPIQITLAELLKMPRVELAAVNQCSGNSRGHFQPRVPGAQWGHGAMGNAVWTGVRLKDVLDRAGVKPGAVDVRLTGLDTPAIEGAPHFEKSLAIDHARDGEVMIAFAMNGEQLPLLNGFPLRIVVPGWFSTYWIKMLSRIEVLPAPDDQYWMAKAYRIPTTPGANVAPGAKGFDTVPINRMIPRSWVTTHGDGETVTAGAPLAVGGIAMGGDSGVSRVEASGDGGKTWVPARLGRDHGPYSFRRWDADLPAPARGGVALAVRCTNSKGMGQPTAAIWNPAGFLRGNVEVTNVLAG